MLHSASLPAFGHGDHSIYKLINAVNVKGSPRIAYRSGRLVCEVYEETLRRSSSIVSRWAHWNAGGSMPLKMFIHQTICSGSV